jgi:hypothetical protein
MPSGTSSAVMATVVPPSTALTLPGHRHRAREGRVVGNEVHGLDDPDVGNDVDVPSFDDVCVSSRLPGSARMIDVRQDQSATRACPPTAGCGTVGYAADSSVSCALYEVEQLIRSGNQVGCPGVKKFARRAVSPRDSHCQSAAVDGGEHVLGAITHHGPH